MDWCFRLTQELKNSDSAKFLTLTYDESNLPWNDETGNSELCPGDLTTFFKKVRYANKKNDGDTNPKSVRHYSVGEYGSTFGRPHYHSIIFNLHEETLHQLPKIWELGSHYIGEVTGASIGYVTGYSVTKRRADPSRRKPFARMSRRPGIGNNYLNANQIAWHKNSIEDLTELEDLRAYVQDGSFRRRMPRYYRDRIFSTSEKEVASYFAQREQEANYASEIKRLSLVHPDPDAYFQACVLNAHDEIEKSFKKNYQF